MKPVIISLSIVIVCTVFLISSFFFNQNQPEAIAEEINANNVTLTQSSTEKSTLIADASQLKPRGNKVKVETLYLTSLP